VTRPGDSLAGRFTSRWTWALIGALIALVGALALCLDRFHNGDFYLSLVSGRLSHSTASSTSTRSPLEMGSTIPASDGVHSRIR
jgi:hypothetical protein